MNLNENFSIFCSSAPSECLWLIAPGQTLLLARLSTRALALNSICHARRLDADWCRVKARQAQLGTADHVDLPLAHQKLEPLAVSAFAQAPVPFDGNQVFPAIEARLVLAGLLPRAFLRAAIAARVKPAKGQSPAAATEAAVAIQRARPCQPMPRAPAPLSFCSRPNRVPRALTKSSDYD